MRCSAASRKCISSFLLNGDGRGREKGTVEYFTPMANKCSRGDSHHQLEGMFKKVRPARPQPFWRAERTLST